MTHPDSIGHSASRQCFTTSGPDPTSPNPMTWSPSTSTLTSTFVITENDPLGSSYHRRFQKLGPLEPLEIRHFAEKSNTEHALLTCSLRGPISGRKQRRFHFQDSSGSRAVAGGQTALAAEVQGAPKHTHSACWNAPKLDWYWTGIIASTQNWRLSNTATQAFIIAFVYHPEQVSDATASVSHRT